MFLLVFELFFLVFEVFFLVFEVQFFRFLGWYFFRFFALVIFLFPVAASFFGGDGFFNFQRRLL